LLISIVIPTSNGVQHLPVCLAALRRQTLPPHQVIVVDNASTDATRDVIARDYPEVTFIRLPENRLFTGACNTGIRASTGEAIALLNNDTEADERWLENIAAALISHPEAGLVASKLRLFDQRDHLHSAGDTYSVRGLPANRGVWQKDAGQFDTEYVFGACGAASVYRRSMLDKIGLLDEAFQFSCEDVDMSWRAALAGYKCVFAHHAIVYHKVSATGGGALAAGVVTWNIGGLAAGASASVTLVVKVNSPLANATVIHNNTYSITSAQVGPVSGSCSAPSVGRWCCGSIWVLLQGWRSDRWNSVDRGRDRGRIRWGGRALVRSCDQLSRPTARGSS